MAIIIIAAFLGFIVGVLVASIVTARSESDKVSDIYRKEYLRRNKK